MHVRGFFRIAPSNNDHHPAIRCAIGVGLPLLTLLAIGRTDLSIFAVLGAFTGAYGRGQTHRPRLVQQSRAGALLLVAIASGMLASRSGIAPEWTVWCTAGMGALGFLAARIGRLKPDGSLFYVFAFSAVAFIRTPAPWLPALATAVATVALSLVVGVAGRALPSHRAAWVLAPKSRLSSQERREALVEATMHAVAIALSGTIAVGAGFGHSYWAMIAATAVLVGATAARRIERGVHRIIGTLGGLAITGVILGLHLRVWPMIIVVLVLQFLVELFIARHYALAQAFVTPLALLMTEVARPTNPWMLMADRAVETLIGAGVGMALVLLVHGFRSRPEVRGRARQEGARRAADGTRHVRPIDSGVCPPSDRVA